MPKGLRLDQASVDRAAATKAPADRVTFTCCVEYGSLEEGTIRFAESLRRFGGPFAEAQIVAVTPRRGAPLRAETLKRFKELGVKYVRAHPPNRYSWMAYVNKYFALREAEKIAKSEFMVWMDSDVIVMRPPHDLVLSEGEDFAACPRDKNIGSTGPEDQMEWYWRKVCGDVGLMVADLPWVETISDKEKIRLYWNAGIFSYRSDTNFLKTWHDCIETVLDKTDSSSLEQLFWTDQVCLGLAAKLQNTPYRHWGDAMNYGIATHFKDHLSLQGLRDAQLLHYHDSMKPGNWAWLMDWLGQSRPDVADWLSGLGPIESAQPVLNQAIFNAYRSLRQIKRRVWSLSHGATGLGF